MTNVEKSEFLKVKNEKFLFKSKESKGIINNNTKGFEQYMSQKKKLQDKQSEISRLTSDVKTLEKRISALEALFNTTD